MFEFVELPPRAGERGGTWVALLNRLAQHLGGHPFGFALRELQDGFERLQEGEDGARAAAHPTGG